ncbi:MAG: hypothetical protein HRT44_02080 [Bdellovibrionales bacterium]|nr:HEXXH motif-containing putative peptide modification protein [Bdellovibrionales bacterium]NQZ18035.1 hypothetical protein [Bdellovibrionales bacterium]
MKSFLFGSEAVPVQSKLFSTYCQNRMLLAEKNKGMKIDQYHPVLSHETIYERIPVDKLEDLLKTSKVVSFEPELLKIKEKIYVDNPYIQGLDSEHSKYSLYTNILEEYPDVGNELVKGLELIQSYGGWMGQMFDTIIHEICPIRLKRSTERFRGGFSDYNLIGSIFISHMPEPHAQLELAISLVHELGHQALMLLQAAENPIHSESLDDWIYSSVRKVDRPVLGAVHALIAALYMADFALNLLKLRENSEDEKSYLRQQVSQHLKSVQDGVDATGGVKLTSTGEKVIRDVVTFNSSLEKSFKKCLKP